MGRRVAGSVKHQWPPIRASRRRLAAGRPAVLEAMRSDDEARIMLNFDEPRFLRIQSGAVALEGRIRRAVGTLLARGARNLFFLGTGGAAILMQPAALLLQRRSGFSVFQEIAAELVRSGSVHLGRGSIVVVPSLSGTTAESVEAMTFCRRQGATIVSLVGHADTPLGREADIAFVNFAEDDTSSESFYIQSLLIALAIMETRGEGADYGALVAGLSALPPLLLDVKRAFENEAERVAAAIQADPYHIITGAGSTWAEAFYYGMCILEEMQWIRTRPVHAADFFHGTLELVEPGVSVVLLKGEDEHRPVAERVERFAAGYTTKLTVLDSAPFVLPGISPALRALISPIVLATVLERVSAHLAVKRSHPLATRRYYRRVTY
jgi:fructoselysine-6-phosphate deglycase